MVVESFSLTELLLARQWLIMAQGSRNCCGMTKGQVAEIGKRTREIDAELTLRIIDGVKPNIINYEDPDFTETVKEEFGRGIELEDPDGGV